jgi:hypothetical protein
LHIDLHGIRKTCRTTHEPGKRRMLGPAEIRKAKALYISIHWTSLEALS